MFQEVFIWQHNKKLILGLVDLIRYYSFADSTLRTLDGIVFPKRESNGCVVREFRDFTFWYKFDDSGSRSVVNQERSDFEEQQNNGNVEEQQSYGSVEEQQSDGSAKSSQASRQALVVK